MTDLSKGSWRLGLAAVAAVTLAGLAGCNETAPPAAPPAPPPAAYQPPPAPPPLLGAPPPAAEPAPAREFITMAPIPNPEDMPPAERRRIYGDRFWTNHRYIAGIIHARHAAHHAAWHAVAAPAHAPKPILPKPVIAKPVVAATPAPAPVAASTPKPTPVLTQPPSPTDRLATAVNGQTKAVLAVPADLSAAKPGAVTLSLPADLFATIRAEAAKLGLGRAAKKSEVTATLHGDGYTITPPGPQTAPLTPGKPTRFTWQVVPGAGAKGPLTADVNAALKGAGDAKTFALAQLKQAVAAVDAAAAQAEATHKFKLPSLDMLSIPGHKTVTLPVVGKTKSKHLVGGIIVLIALFLMAMAARAGSARREAENRQRRYRTMSTVMSTAAPEETITPLPPAQDPAHEPHAEPVYAEAAAPVAVEALATSEGHGDGHGDHPAPDSSQGHDAEAHAGEHGADNHGESDVHGHPSLNGVPYGIPGVTPSLEPRGPVVEHIAHEEPAVGYPIAVEHPVEPEAHAQPVAEPVMASHDPVEDHAQAEDNASDHGHGAADSHSAHPIRGDHGLVLESV